MRNSNNLDTKFLILKRTSEPFIGLLVYKGNYTYEVLKIIKKIEERGDGYIAYYWKVKARIYGPNPYKINRGN